MDALSNARITVQNSSKGSESFAPPKAENTQTGVSVEYVFDPKKSWFVLRASYGRSGKAADLLINAGHYVYIARRYEYRVENGHRRRELKELIPNILFAYIEKSEIKALLSRKMESPSEMPELALIASFYYNHFQQENGKNPPLEIPGYEMQRFINITRTNDDNLVYVNNSSIVHVKNHDLVRVTGGKFEGCVGMVVRVAGQQRVGLRLADLGWVATSYVPSAFLEVVTQEDYDSHLEALHQG